MKFLSLFSGIEAASAAWKPLGWECVGVAEIDPFPCAVLRHHYPDVPNLGSVTDITDEQIAALGPIDLVVGGSPCQDLSVAGKRAGLAGERSGLFHEQLRIFHAARHLCGARFLLWENVPGAFSSNRGRDFAVVVGAMAGCSVPVPSDGWGTEGVVLGEHGLVEWAVLDAQWFGVAQRRRRVFALLDVGDWSGRPPILLEPDSLRGDSAPSREAGEVSPTIPSRRSCGGGLGTDFDCDGGLIHAPGRDVDSEQTYVAVPLQEVGKRTGISTDDRRAGVGIGKDGDPMFTLLASAQHGIAFMADDYKDGGYEECDTARPLTTSADRTRAAPVIAFSGKDYGADAGEVAPTLRSMGHDGSHANGGGQVAVAISEVTTLAIRGRGESHDLETRTDGTANALLTPNGGRAGIGVGAIHFGMQVRRLTPVECCRLQGFPDDYLSQVPWRGKATPPDGPMYKALGNSFAVPVVRWIGEQIEKASKSQ